MFLAADVEAAMTDVEQQVARVRGRLREIQALKATAPVSNEEDCIILRKSVRLRGFVEGDHVVSGEELAGNGGRGRRASLSSDSYEKIRDRVIRTFNLDFKKGIKLMRENGFGRTAHETANFLLNTGGLNREEVGKALGSFTDERGLKALALFAEGVEMEGLPFMQSLRKFLGKFKLPGESQMVDRIMEAFSEAFYKANPSDFPNQTMVYALAFAVIMLNTDMYSPSLQKNRLPKMTKKQFVANTKHIDATAFTTEFLEEIYNDIARSEISHTDTKHDEGNLFHDAVKEGWMKKQSDSAPYQWQKRYFILTKSPPQLYYFKGEGQIDPTGYIPLENITLNKMDPKKHKKGFEMVPSAESGMTTVKSAKYGAGGALQLGQHMQFSFKGESIEEAWEWIRMINVVMRRGGSSVGGGSERGEGDENPGRGEGS